MHVPAIEALKEFVAGAMDTFERGPNGLFGTKEKNFAEVTQHGEYGGDSGKIQRAPIRKTMDEGEPRTDGPNMNPGKVRGDFATQPFGAEVFDEDSAGIATSGGQAQEAAGEVIVLDATNVAALVGECFGDGVVESHALFARV